MGESKVRADMMSLCTGGRPQEASVLPAAVGGHHEGLHSSQEKERGEKDAVFCLLSIMYVHTTSVFLSFLSCVNRSFISLNPP